MILGIHGLTAIACELRKYYPGLRELWQHPNVNGRTEKQGNVGLNKIDASSSFGFLTVYK